MNASQSERKIAINAKRTIAVKAKLASLDRISAVYRELEKSEKLRMELSVIDRIAHELLVHPDMSGAVTTKQLREMLRYKVGIRELTGMSSHIHAAVDMLLRERILENVPQDIGESYVRRRFNKKKPPALEFKAVAQSKPKRRGRRLYTIQKRSWTAIEADCASAAAVKRLLVPYFHFI